MDESEDEAQNPLTEENWMKQNNWIFIKYVIHHRHPMTPEQIKQKHILKFSLQLALFSLCMAIRILFSTFWFEILILRVPKCEAVNFDKYSLACVNSMSISNSWHATYT